MVSGKLSWFFPFPLPEALDTNNPLHFSESLTTGHKLFLALAFCDSSILSPLAREALARRVRTVGMKLMDANEPVSNLANSENCRVITMSKPSPGEGIANDCITLAYHWIITHFLPSSVGIIILAPFIELLLNDRQWEFYIYFIYVKLGNVMDISFVEFLSSSWFLVKRQPLN